MSKQGQMKNKMSSPSLMASLYMNHEGTAPVFKQILICSCLYSSAPSAWSQRATDASQQKIDWAQVIDEHLNLYSLRTERRDKTKARSSERTRSISSFDAIWKFHGHGGSKPGLRRHKLLLVVASPSLAVYPQSLRRTHTLIRLNWWFL